ncbi:MAG: cytochrome b N-terminal domain-containing protein [Nitrospirota bacterium]
MLKSIWGWLNDRWPFSYLIHLALDEEIPGGSRFAHTFGSAILTVFLLQATTGVIQLFFYVPAIDHAYDSVNFLRTKVPFGWLINGLHYWGANAMIVVVLLHVSRVFIWGAYKNPRQLTWLFGVSLLLVVMGLSFTGGPLSWDQRAYWEAEVGTSMPGSLPVIGDTVRRIMRGGERLGQLTLSRFFIIHTAILPATLLALISAHLIAFRKFGSVGPWDERKRETKGLFWPDQVFKDLIIGMLVLFVLITLCVFSPKPFNGAADPLDATLIPKPEWNFLFLYEALKFFKGRLEPAGVAGIPAVLVLLFLLPPFLDRRSERNPFRRPVAMLSALLIAGILITLTIAGYLSKPEGAETASISPKITPEATLSATEQKGAQLFQSLGCGGCHRINGVGGTIGPDLSNEGSQGRTREWLSVQIRNPREHFPNSVMPAFTSLTDEEVNALVDYLLSLGTKTSVFRQRQNITSSPVTTTSPSTVPGQKVEASLSISEKQPGRAASIIGSAYNGGLLFERECSSCHGPEGTDKVSNPGSEDGLVPALNPIDRELFNNDPEIFTENIDRFIQHGSTPAGANPQLKMIAFGDTNALTQQQISNIEAYILHLNGVNRSKLVNPGMRPLHFFSLVVAVYALLILVQGGIRMKKNIP